MDHLRHRKCKNKQLENNFKLINISPYDRHKLGKKRFNKEENIYKKTWHNWYDFLINYVPEPIKKVGGVKN